MENEKITCSGIWGHCCNYFYYIIDRRFLNPQLIPIQNKNRIFHFRKKYHLISNWFDYLKKKKKNLFANRFDYLKFAKA
jgi:hypothetical protein